MEERSTQELENALSRADEIEDVLISMKTRSLM